MHKKILLTAKQVAEVAAIIFVALLISFLIYFYTILRLDYNKSKKVLFFQQAQYAVLEVKNNVHLLTLSNTPSSIFYFTERPNKNFGYIPLTNFMKMWWDTNVKDGFIKNPPTSLLSWENEGSMFRHKCMLVLDKPTYDAKAKRIKYIVKYMPSDCSIEKNTKLHKSELFIDYFPWHN